MDETLKTCACELRSSPRRASSVTWNGPVRFVAIIRYHVAGESSGKGWIANTPALLTSTSRIPSAGASAPSTPRSTESRSVTSISIASPRPPARSHSRATSSISSRVRAATATCAPSRAKRRAMARPIPRPPPVTSTESSRTGPAYGSGRPRSARYNPPPDGLEPPGAAIPARAGLRRAAGARLRARRAGGDALLSPDGDLRRAADRRRARGALAGRRFLERPRDPRRLARARGPPDLCRSPARQALEAGPRSRARRVRARDGLGGPRGVAGARALRPARGRLLEPRDRHGRGQRRARDGPRALVPDRAEARDPPPRAAQPRDGRRHAGVAGHPRRGLPRVCRAAGTIRAASLRALGALLPRDAPRGGPRAAARLRGHGRERAALPEHALGHGDPLRLDGPGPHRDGGVGVPAGFLPGPAVTL